MKAVTKEERRVAYPLVLIFLLLAAGIATAAIGLLTLLGWVLELPLLTSFGADLIPMAPSTALLFLLYGAAVCLRARTPLSQRAFQISVALVGLGTVVALLLFTLGCLNIYSAVEHLGLSVSQTVGGAPIGHMSPVTAFCFLLASVSLLGSLSRSATRPWRSALALGAAGVLVGTGFIFLLAYFIGTPLLYGGTFIPPALNTVLSVRDTGTCASGFGRSARPGCLADCPGTVPEPVCLRPDFRPAGGGHCHGRLPFLSELRAELLLRRRAPAFGHCGFEGGRTGAVSQGAAGDAGIFLKNDGFSVLVQRFLDRSGGRGRATADSGVRTNLWRLTSMTMFACWMLKASPACHRPSGLPQVTFYVRSAFRKSWDRIK